MSCNNNIKKCGGKVGAICPPAAPQAFGDNLFYTGPNVSNIKNLDTLNTVIQKLAAQLSCIPPAVVTQPTGSTITLGDPFSLTAEFSGSAYDIQWYKDGGIIAGATNATYSVSSSQASDIGGYYATASNLCGTATTNTVNIAQAAAKTFNYGSNVDGSVPTDPTTLQHSATYTVGHDLTGDFSDVVDPAYLLFVTPSTDPLYGRWKITESNQGQIDSAPNGSNLFYYTVANGYRYYITNYPTLSPDPITLSVV